MSNHEIAINLIRRVIKGTKWENQVFLAGGYVRDKLLGKTSKDVDLVITRENGGVLFSLWLHQRYRELTDGEPVIFPRFGTAKTSLWVGSSARTRERVAIECVMPRLEIYTDVTGRNPEVQYTTLEEDAKRRDFTVNALFENVSTGEIIDLVGGRKDIENGLVRTAIDPKIIFKDDPLRMLRAIRFVNRFQWRMTAELYNAISRDAHLIQNISAERIQDELNKMLLVNRPSLAIRNLRSTGLLKHILPELDEMSGVTQNEYHIDDVFAHSMKVLDHAPSDLVTRLSALFHDVGKPPCRKVVDGKVKFKGHDEVGSVLAVNALYRLKYPNDIQDAVGYIVHDHMRLKSDDDTAKDVTDKTLRKLRKDAGENLDRLLLVMDADNVSHHPNHCTPNRITNIIRRLTTMKNIPAKPKLPIDGNDVMQLLGIGPGPRIKTMLQIVEDMWMENPTLTRDEAIEAIKAADSLLWSSEK
jgi:poly(A) polymerase